MTPNLIHYLARVKNQIHILKALISLTVIIAFLSISVAPAQHWLEEDEGYVSRRKGLEFGVNMGVYMANNNQMTSSSIFYNGSGYYELGDNSATLYSIEERLNLGTTEAQVTNMLNTDGFQIPYDAYGYMRYDPGMMFGLKAVRFWNPESAIVLSFDAASLKATGFYTMNLNGLPGQGQGMNNTKLYGVIGEERRMLTTLGFRTSMYITDRSSWIFELGGIATGTQVVENYCLVETTPYNLLVTFNGPGQISGPTSNLTNLGFGFYTTIGLEALFEEGGNLEANLRLSRDNVKLGSQETDDFGVLGYQGTQWNAAIYVTWMIPPHVGEYVRASF